MLAPRAVRSLALHRPFSTSAVRGKSPSIRDITPETAAAFTARQKEFRENLEAARKRKHDQESQSVDAPSSARSSPSSSFSSSSPVSSASSASSAPASAPSAAAASSKSATAAAAAGGGDAGPSSAPTAPSASNASRSRSVVDAADSLDTQALGSLSTHRIVGEERQAEINSSQSARRGPISSLIYGTKEGQQLDRDIERSFSEVLARGKYVHSIVFHEVKPDRVDEYVDLVGEWYPKMAGTEANRVNLVGSWRTQVGDNDTFIHIWEYQRYTGYHASLHSISMHPQFREFDRKLKTLINSKRTSLMQEFSFWPTTPPRRLGGVFELRSYTLHPGNLLEWETHWRRGLAARRQIMEGVGAWFVQIGDLNTVHHMWQFADLEERKTRRERSWSIEGWADTVHKTVPLIQTMNSRILIPMPWSPVG